MFDPERSKSPVHATFDEAGSRSASAVALQHSNSESVTDAIINEADHDLRSAASNSFDGLKAHARVGRRLDELKAHLDHGNFERVVKARLGLKKQWRARIMKVGRELPDIMTAIEWAKANNRLTRSEYSVDGALALLAAWRREIGSNGANFSPAGERFCDSSFAPKETVNKAKLIEYLKQFVMFLLLELLRARHRIAFLESEIERLSGPPYVDVPPADQFALPLLEHTE